MIKLNKLLLFICIFCVATCFALSACKVVSEEKTDNARNFQNLEDDNQNSPQENGGNERPAPSDAECTHNYVFVAEMPATCTENGYLAHYKCDKCQKLFDIEYNELSLGELTINPLGHDCGNFIEQVDATHESCGELGHYHCNRCEKDFDENMQALETITIPRLLVEVEVESFEEITEALSNSSIDKIKLSHNLDILGTIVIPRDVIFDLNGHTLQGDNYIFNIQAQLTIIDSSNGTGKIYNDSFYLFNIENTGHLIVYDGIFYGEIEEFNESNTLLYGGYFSAEDKINDSIIATGHATEEIEIDGVGYIHIINNN